MNKTEIKNLEQKVTKDRKLLIMEKIEYCLQYRGDEYSKQFLDFLKTETTTKFKYGDVLDFEQFKKDYLVSFKNIEKFNEFYSNTALCYDELMYIGFGDDLSIVPFDEFVSEFYDKIRACEFSDDDLNEFEYFVNVKFNICCE